ncbi:peptide deformylase [bacterium]|nr:peptide deformylase [bacterium]
MELTNTTLYNTTKEVTFEEPFVVQNIGVKLMQVMDHEGGIGLASNQVGLDIRLFVTNVDGQYTSFFNPKIVDFSEYMIEFEEGCLSFPDEYHIIKRPESINIEYQDYLGRTHRKTLEGLACRVWLHEYDHLEGITFQQRAENRDIPESMKYVKE